MGRAQNWFFVLGRAPGWGPERSGLGREFGHVNQLGTRDLASFRFSAPHLCMLSVSAIALL